jgi:hypothetical protein
MSAPNAAGGSQICGSGITIIELNPFEPVTELALENDETRFGNSNIAFEPQADHRHILLDEALPAAGLSYDASIFPP